VTTLFRDRCPCGNSGTRPGGDPCPDYPRCHVEDVVARHVGRGQAIALAQICAVTRLGEREIKQAVHDLRMDGVHIGSSRGAEGTAGYYMIESADELRAFLRAYGRQAISELRLIQRMLGKDEKWLRELEGQLALDLGEDSAA